MEEFKRKMDGRIKIGLERIYMQKRITIEALLDSKSIRLVMSLEFTKKTKV